MAIIPVFIPHAGCPHQCVFCNQKTISGQQLASVEQAALQIKKYLQWVKPSTTNELAFYGGSFTGLEESLQRQLLALAIHYRDAGVIGSIRVSTRPDYVEQAQLKNLLAAGVGLVELGVQSLDDKVLQLAERGHCAAVVAGAVQRLRVAGLKVGLQLMVGMPGQSFDSVKATVDEVLLLQPDVVRIYPLIVVAGTPLATLYQQGSFQPLTLEDAVVQTAYMYQAFTKQGIKVIRMGLQADAELCRAGSIIAGPFHSAFGEMVYSWLYHEEIGQRLLALQQEGITKITLTYPQREESKIRGQKNCNLRYWQTLLSQAQLVLVAGTNDCALQLITS
ncbi:MAG: radical SAM protein [Acidaminococcaceae bacterium]